MWVTGVKSTEGYINNLYQQRAIFTKTCERKRPDTVTSSYKKKTCMFFSYWLSFSFHAYVMLSLSLTCLCQFHCDVLLIFSSSIVMCFLLCQFHWSVFLGFALWYTPGFFFPIVIVRCFLFLPVSMTLRLRVQCRRFILPLNHKVEVWVLDRYKNHSGVMSV